MLEPKDIEIGGKTYVIGKFSAIAGRAILLQYPTSALPKIGDYATNEQLMLQIMSYVGVRIDGRDDPLVLKTRQLVDNHVPDTETLMKLEFAVLSHNFSFFRDGKMSGILELVANQAATLIQKTLTDLSRASSGSQGQQP